MQASESVRAAIYARYSSELQRETSVQDQVRLCTEACGKLGLTVVAAHWDSAISGATPVMARAGGREMLLGAREGRFSVLIVEGLDRISRDTLEQERIVRMLEHRGVRIVGVLDGYDSSQGEMRKLARGVRGLINQEYLEDLRHKTHRGMAGQITRGFHVGPRCYGYTSGPAGFDPSGNVAGYKAQIVAEQAEVVRRIFREYGSGQSCQRIVYALNEDGIPGPGGRPWKLTTLYGSPRKGSGILNNQLYVGRVIWNRSEWIKDPQTHKRQRRDRPQREWITRVHPELRIIEDTEWEAVHSRLHNLPSEQRPRRQRSLLPLLGGGLLRCGQCAGPMVAVDRHAYGCANRRSRGPTACTAANVPRSTFERLTLRAVHDHLRLPEQLAQIESEVLRLIADA